MKKNSHQQTSGWFTAEVAGFGLASFFSDLSHEAATALLPLFLASLGAPAYALGLIEGISDGLASFAKILGGWVSDRLGNRKPLAVFGYFLTGITQGMYAFASVWPLALVFRAVGWLGRGWRSPVRDALLHEAVPKDSTAKAFGFNRALDTLGATLAPALALFLISRMSYRDLFFLTWLPGLLAPLCFWLLVRERKVKVFKPFSLGEGLKALPGTYKKFLAAVTLFGFADFSHTVLIYWAGVLLAPVHGSAKAASLAIALYTLHNLVYAAAAYPVGHWADRIGKTRALAAGYGLACLMFFILIFAKGNLWFLGVVFMLAGLYMAVQDVLERAIAGDLLPAEIKGTGYGVLASLNGVGDFFSSLIVGFLLSTGSRALAFGYCLSIGLLGLWGILGLAAKSK